MPFFITLIVSALLAVGASFFMHGSDKMVHNYLYYFVPIVVGSEAGALIAWKRGKSILSGAFFGTIIGFFAIALMFLALVLFLRLWGY